MRALFVVQGEGRGHMTQALALAEAWRARGHDLAAALVGRSAARRVPAFFHDGIRAPLVAFESPNFALDGAGRGVVFLETAWYNATRIGRFWEGLRTLARSIDGFAPDVVVNFCEPLCGLLYAVRRPRTPMVAVAHQFMFVHPRYLFPEGAAMKRLALQGFTRLVGLGAARRLALSFYDAEDLPDRRLAVVPPILRQGVLKRPRSEDDGSLLVYLLNAGYADELRAWNARHPDVPIHCFWDQQDAPEVVRETPTLTFHRLHATRFVDRMARCHAVATTAGFESISEAMYFGKPVLVRPVDGHFEQATNALDASRLGAALPGDRFDLSALLNFAEQDFQPQDEAFRTWVRAAPDLIARHVEEVAAGRR